MKEAYKKFKKMIQDTKEMKALQEYLDNSYIGKVISTNDLLRWQWVQCVSAFDSFIHDIVRTGMIEIYQKKRNPTSQYNNFPITILTHNDIYHAEDESDKIRVLEKNIIRKHGYKSFQDPSKVLEALSYIWENNFKIDDISSHMTLSTESCKTQWKNIVIRRHQIVHQGDYTDPFFLDRETIFPEDVDVVREFILKLGEAIFNCIS